ncbi:hypothetical protein BKA63DRAFT_494598 [Paraphoma chrysanthemicola]|nr:hypothetical protein BKA63DRAFT_494598 [Paraphoma chrysanthemicola]
MPHTHSSLRAQFLRQARIITSEVSPETDHHDVAQADRVREVLLMAVRLIDAWIGTPDQIEDIVEQRIEEIQEEMRPFVPDPFDVDPPAQQDEQPRLPPYFFSGVVAVIHNARRVNEAAQQAALQATPPRLPLLAIDSAFGSPVTILEDLESPSYGRDRIASMRAQMRAEPPLTRSVQWMHIHTRLRNMLEEHITAHANRQRGLDYHEIVVCLEDAIESADSRPGDLRRIRFLERVKMDLESFKKVEERRREFLEASQYEEGRLDNGDQQEEVLDELTDVEDVDEDWEDEDSDTTADSSRTKIPGHVARDWHSPLVVKRRRAVSDNQEEKDDEMEEELKLMGSQTKATPSRPRQERAPTVKTTIPTSPQTADIATALGNWHDSGLTPRRNSGSPQTSTTNLSPSVTPSQIPATFSRAIAILHVPPNPTCWQPYASHTAHNATLLPPYCRAHTRRAPQQHRLSRIARLSQRLLGPCRSPSATPDRQRQRRE